MIITHSKYLFARNVSLKLDVEVLGHRCLLDKQRGEGPNWRANGIDTFNVIVPFLLFYFLRLDSLDRAVDAEYSAST